MTFKRLATTALITAALSTAASAADEPPPTRSAIIDELVDSALKRARVATIKEPFASTVSGSPGLLITYLIDVAVEREERKAYRTLLDAMDARWSKQIGSSPSSTGSTSVAVKGLVPEILGLAVEHGAITREVDGTSITFRATPAGLVQALGGQGLSDMYRHRSRSGALRAAARLSAAVTFDTTRGEASGTLLANRQQLSAWSVRLNAFNGRDPGAARYAPLWAGLSRESQAYIDASLAFQRVLPAWNEFKQWQDELVAASRKIDAEYAVDHDLPAAAAGFRALLEESLPGLAHLPMMPAALLAALDTYVAELTKVQKGIDSIYAFVEKGPAATLEWTTLREPAVPDLYALTGVFEGGLGRLRQNDLSLNLNLNFYRSAPQPTGRRFKSFSASAEYTHLLGKVRDLPLTLAFSGRYEHIPEDVAVTPVDGDAAFGAAMPMAIAPKGDMVVGQVKLTFPLSKGSGIKVPVALTVANRTELIKETEVRANFGFTIDLDSVLAAALAR